MRNLTTADVAFLLCTAQRGARYRLTLETDYGLLIDVSADGGISASLTAAAKPQPDAVDDDDDVIIDTPISTTRGRFRFPPPASLNPGHGLHITGSGGSSSIDAILLSPISPAATPFSPFSPSESPPLNPGGSRARKPPLQLSTPAPTQKYRYRIWPDWHSSTYIWYAPGSTSSSSSSSSSSSGSGSGSGSSKSSQRKPKSALNDRRVRESDLERRYAPAWFDAYLDWSERAERALLKIRQQQNQQQGQPLDPKSPQTPASGYPGGGGGGSWKRRNPFTDDGERTLWVVEGLLLACWLGLQDDVGVVEYQPADEIYSLHRGSVGSVLAGFLSSVK